LAYDFSTDKRFLGQGGRRHGGLMHFSDWMPTFLGFAGVSSDELALMKTELALDGFDQGASIRAGAKSWRDGPRQSVLCKFMDIYMDVF
jgi:arylsulfatase A-like enzyme